MASQRTVWPCFKLNAVLGTGVQRVKTHSTPCLVRRKGLEKLMNYSVPASLTSRVTDTHLFYSKGLVKWVSGLDVSFTICSLGVFFYLKLRKLVEK